ncbi:aminotransferase class I/II-fold pyridoxal phosphate-dependent enzyme [Swaminathania salitolerans]|uniref:Aminotransferase n=1 Tax=Swaminathania salitolerans TaxID=182838 RepID=A0A511BQD1_9PROT|nr:aminotransferase class I/II-fold pyridoxal phosphate-dependent enzyme [Swaminathania salitolerans]GBQ11610.1 L-threonine-O-3-phosphate decarboxylase [Swaminathania salitolerans LMG 21291]GEL02557.1 threonine-phosphate decarboxylase [Swaminathania salitolerans]
MTPWPVHGGRLSDLARFYPQAPQPWIDLSTGINPHAYPFSPLPSSAFRRLPDPREEARLIGEAARCYGVEPSCVLAGPGTQCLIGMLARILAENPASRMIRIVEPTYSGHAEAWRAAGARVAALAWGDDLSPGEKGAITVLCSPNNPTGHALDLSAVRTLADAHGRLDGLLIVDEAFADFEPQSAASLLPHPALIVCRSFGKAYGLAGLRLGFLLGSHPAIGVLRRMMGPWAVNTPACLIASEALADTAWRETMKRRVETEMTALCAVMRAAGLVHIGGTSLFALFRCTDAPGGMRPETHDETSGKTAGKTTGETTAETSGAAFRLWSHLASAGILVRRFAWDETVLRFGLPEDAAALDRLRVALG